MVKRLQGKQKEQDVIRGSLQMGGQCWDVHLLGCPAAGMSSCWGLTDHATKVTAGSQQGQCSACHLPLLTHPQGLCASEREVKLLLQ